MRITIDVDHKSRIALWWVCFKGRILLGKSADNIYKTRKGWHVIWHSLPMTEQASITYRKILGDDKNRIRLDHFSNKRLHQVLFSEKTIRYYDPAKSLDEDKTLLKTETYIRRRIK
jgi:hypothetical protein